ncbi:hypothetical protein C8R45DRAFT_1088298 [Mycena sanguinolenta]|nr:hypothetical protein C8R45DRAFT_1088298 [Mycena sanguinolenta]
MDSSRRCSEAAASWFLAVSAAAQEFSINTPVDGGRAGAPECQPLLITWNGGTPPYFVVSLFSSPDLSQRRTATNIPFFQSVDDSGFTPLIQFDEQTGTSLIWPAVNFTVGTELYVASRLASTSDLFQAAIASRVAVVAAVVRETVTTFFIHQLDWKTGSSGTPTQSSSPSTQSSSTTNQSSSTHHSSSTNQSSPSANQSSTSPTSSNTGLATKKKKSLVQEA